jgi:hypothetical protein
LFYKNYTLERLVIKMIEPCQKCAPEDIECEFCRCEMRNIEVAKKLREQGKSPWSKKLCAECIKSIEQCKPGAGESIEICANCSVKDAADYLGRDYLQDRMEKCILWDERRTDQLLKLLNEQFLFLKNGDCIRRDNMSDELKSRVLNVDTVKEMFDLWYEVTFLRFLMTEIVNHNESLGKFLDQDTFENCRRKAQVFLKDKFKIDLEYQNPKETK